MGGVLRRLRLLAACLALVVAARADDGPEADYVKAREALLPRLRALAAWCGEKKLVLERDRACESILALLPDDAAARKTLHYSKTKDGKWQRGIVPKPSPTDPAFADEVKTRREEALGRYRDVVLALPEAPPAPRERALEELLGVDPECVPAREARRETKVGDRWLLEETTTCKERRKALLAAVAEARKGPAPQMSAPTDVELVVAAKWPDVREPAQVRVLGGPGVAETDVVARNVGVVRALFAEAVGVAPPEIPGFRMYLLASPIEGFAAVDRDPRASADERKWARSLACLWLRETNDVFIWTDHAQTRVEWGARQAFSACMRRKFGVDDRRGWAWEGFTQWMSDVVVGTHWCFFMRRADYADGKTDQDLQRKLFGATADWTAEARALESGPRWPDLRVTLGKAVETLSPEEVLQSFALAKLLVEGRREDVAPVLTAVGAGDAPDAWVAAKLGMSVEGLDRRLRRWLRETK